MAATDKFRKILADIVTRKAMVYGAEWYTYYLLNSSWFNSATSIFFE